MKNTNSCIYHAFDETYKDIINKLEQLKECGYGQIQISPPQKSRITVPHDAKPGTPTDHKDIWWLRYQPVEHTIGNVYGTREELIELTTLAHNNNMKIIADLALNFMSALNGVGRNEWKRANANQQKKYLQNLNTAYPPFTLDDYYPRSKMVNGKFQMLWFGGELPALRTDTPKVQNIQFKFMQDLVNCGVDGFRYDAIKYMEPTVLKIYLDKFPNTWVYVETMERYDLCKIKKYTSMTNIEDFTWTQWMIDALETKNDVTLLTGAESYIRKQDVIFSLNHDTFNKHLKPWFNNNKNVYLATGFILSIRNGIPLILNAMNNKFIKTGVKFRQLMEHKTDCDSTFPAVRPEKLKNTVLVVERNNYGFYVMNNDNKDVYLRSLVNTNLSGTYTNLEDQLNLVDIKNGVFFKDGKKAALKIKPKTGHFFVKL